MCAGTIASKIVESFDAHGLTPAQIAQEVPCPPTTQRVSERERESE